MVNIFGIKSGKICSERIFFLLRRNEQRRSNIAHTDRVSLPWKRHGAWKRPVDEPATEQREILNPKTLGRKKKRFFNVSCSFLRISALCVIFTKKKYFVGRNHNCGPKQRIAMTSFIHTYPLALYYSSHSGSYLHRSLLFCLIYASNHVVSYFLQVWLAQY